MALLLPLYCFVAITLLGSVSATDDCNDNNLSIIGGHNIFIEDAPYMVALYKLINGTNEATCGGSIIHEQFILTAAHCFSDTNTTSRRVLVGSNSLSTGGVFIDMEDILCHEEYEDTSTGNDICLVKLKDPIEFGSKAALIEPPDEDFDLDVGTLVNVTGWGLTDMHNDSMSNNLKQVTVPLISEECCTFAHLTSNMICAGSRGHDSCEGDSGGPMTYGNVQVGIVSFGPESCGIDPGVYTRVANYLDWIRNTINDNL